MVNKTFTVATNDAGAYVPDGQEKFGFDTANGPSTPAIDNFGMKLADIAHWARTDVILVAAENSPQRSKNIADFVVNGTANNAATTINAAIVSANGEVPIVLQSGTYELDEGTSPILVNVPGTVLVGLSKKAVIKCITASGVGTERLQVTADACVISSLTFDGGGLINSGSAINATAGSGTNLVINNCEGVNSLSFFANITDAGARITNCHVSDVASGFVIGGDAVLRDCTVSSIQGTGTGTTSVAIKISGSAEVSDCNVAGKIDINIPSSTGNNSIVSLNHCLSTFTGTGNAIQVNAGAGNNATGVNVTMNHCKSSANSINLSGYYSDTFVTMFGCEAATQIVNQSGTNCNLYMCTAKQATDGFSIGVDNCVLSNCIGDVTITSSSCTLIKTVGTVADTGTNTVDAIVNLP